MPEAPDPRPPVLHPALVPLVGIGYRFSILHAFAGSRRTSAQLAEILGVTRQSLNHHLEALGAAGWIEVVDKTPARTPERVWAETRPIDWAAVVESLNALATDDPQS